MSNRKEMITFEVQRMTTEAYRNFSKKTKMNMGKKIAEHWEGVIGKSFVTTNIF